MKAFGKVMPAYSFGNSPFYLTGEILLEPKEGIAIEKILNLIGKKASIIRHSKYNYYVLESKDWKNILNHSNEIYESGLVKYCHPNFIAPIKRSADDPLYSDQYYLHNTGQFGGTSGIDINAPGAWNITTGLSPVKIAIIDDGIENHEDFDGRVLSGYTAKHSSDNPDTEGAPNSEDPPSTAISGDPDSPFGHGVSCAGIVAAGHNSKGIRGVAPNVQIVPVNIFNDWEMVDAPYPYDSMVQFTEDAEDFGNAIDYAWDEGDADVLSNSWGYWTDEPDSIASSDHIISAIGRARNQGGAVVVFSSGNTADVGEVPVRFPANVVGVITTGAIDKNGNIQSYSCRGSSMDLVAPSGGGNVRTTDRMGSDGVTTGNYRNDFGGTSAACPQVSGTAALMLSANPQLSESQVRNILQETATDMGASGFDNTFGYGRLNAYKAVMEAIERGPYIIGNSTLCISSKVYSLENFSIESELGITWSATPSHLFTNTSGSGSSFSTAWDGSGSGMGTITATLSGDCGSVDVIRNLWVGKPENYFDVSFNPSPVEEFASTTGTASSEGADSYIWDVINGTFLSGQGKSGVQIAAPSCDKNIWVKVTASNSCGESYAISSLEVTCRNKTRSLNIYPVPADDQMRVTIEGPTDDKPYIQTSQQSLHKYYLYNDRYMLVKQGNAPGNTFQVSTNHLPEGFYFLKVVTSKDTYTRKLEIRH